MASPAWSRYICMATKDIRELDLNMLCAGVSWVVPTNMHQEGLHHSKPIAPLAMRNQRQSYEEPWKAEHVDSMYHNTIAYLPVAASAFKSARGTYKLQKFFSQLDGVESCDQRPEKPTHNVVCHVGFEGFVQELANGRIPIGKDDMFCFYYNIKRSKGLLFLQPVVTNGGFGEVRITLNTRKSSPEARVLCRLEIWLSSHTWNAELSMSERDTLLCLAHVIEDHIRPILSMSSLVFTFPSMRSNFSSSVDGVDCNTGQVVFRDTGPTVRGLRSTIQPFQSIRWRFANVDQVPGDFRTERPKDKEGRFVGVRSFFGIFTLQEIEEIEANTMRTYEEVRGCPKTCQEAVNSQGKTTRSKLFFNARYTWGVESPEKDSAAEDLIIRTDVARAPLWMEKLVTNRLVELRILAPEFVNSYACNIYHTGLLGLGSHFDDEAMTDGTFAIPMPRGAVTVLEQGGYAANCVTHCIRPQDMVGRSGVLILRRIHQHLLEKAEDHEALVRQKKSEEILKQAEMFGRLFTQFFIAPPRPPTA